MSANTPSLNHQFINNCAAIRKAEELQRLGELADPNNFNQALILAETATAELKTQLRLMFRIRLAEEGIANLVISQEAKCPCHLGIGQEAVAVGVSRALRDGDKVFGAHRSHSHYLALQGKLTSLMAEVLGKVTGCSKGMGGSMHLFDPSIGFMGSVPIVGATIPITVGCALGLKMDQKEAVAVSYFGDGATEEGVFHESLNLAAVLKAPVLFVCENNLYSSHLDIALRQPNDMCARYALAHKVPALVVDGNDVVAVRQAALFLIEKMRAGEGPGFIEAVTYRWRGHVGPDENVDVGLRRKAEDLIAWKKRDPIRRLAQSMLENKLILESELQSIEAEEKSAVEAALKFARESAYPETSQLLETVYMH